MNGHLTGRSPSTGQGLRIAFAEGRITAITDEPDPAPGYLAPGLVDLQINGYFGHDLNDDTLSVARVRDLTEALLRHGVTRYLPTLITASEASLTRALGIIAEARAGDPLLARIIPGIHVEGPFISPMDGARGAHPLAHVREPDRAEVERWQEVSGGLVRLVTLSPHSDAAIALVRDLTAMGIRVAIGHTEASPEQIHLAAEAGAVLSTHLGNGAPAMLPRHPNILWAQLAEDRLAASFIADGHHLPADTLKTMLRAKTLARSLLVSDVAAAGGLPPGIYDQPIGGRVELSADGRLGTPGTPFLAGAALTLDFNVARVMTMAGLSLAEALDLATLNPARLLAGTEPPAFGILKIGAPADLIRFDHAPGADRLTILETYIGGEVRWTQ
ncbi:N-acetylglucosamine-6-phosphate deacetylase [Arsenicitalea aurantiaca]|uniref:N-acetylglucosamine-6-phosphate deacetylase n=1 Tax=Arsenicitalea aurantiaca TaxID=1783274 RepID=A0A433XKC8_9HYPH|nr:amidohydrolase family protein [Arsenicitalea aurantiaca]RUT34478.1 N-acetylglucosamine-6-phosphate deacetylase [Arsenicitalea aurantiaca]